MQNCHIGKFELNLEMSREDISAKVQMLFAAALKEAMTKLRDGKPEEAKAAMLEFFENEEDLTQYFHHRELDDVQKELMEKMLFAEAEVSKVAGVTPKQVSEFMTGLKGIAEREFSAFAEMKQSEEATN